MSEVKRYRFKGAAGEYVYANDFDRVTAERDALQQLLTAADERWDRLEALTNEDLIAIARHAALNSVHRYNYMPEVPEDAYAWEPHYWVIEAMRAALKPAEGGGDGLDAHDRSSQAYWADQAAQGKPYEQQLREACERNNIDHGLDSE